MKNLQKKVYKSTQQEENESVTSHENKKNTNDNE